MNDTKQIYLSILKLYRNRKNKEVIEYANKYLAIVPADDNWIDNVRFVRAKALRYLGHFEDAIEELKELSKLEKDSAYATLELFHIYYYLHYYEKALGLLPELYTNKNKNTANYSLLITEIVMRKGLGMPVSYKKGTRSDYIKSQVVNYNEELALNHIKNHMHFEQTYNEYSTFNDNVDIDYLFECVKNNLENSQKANVKDTLEIHFFSVHGIGYDKNCLCNYLKVVVCPNTKNIITMYPYSYLIDEKHQVLNCDYNKLFKKEQKQKIISRVDKFNQRYNLK